MKFLDENGLSALWEKIKRVFLPKSEASELYLEKHATADKAAGLAYGYSAGTETDKSGYWCKVGTVTISKLYEDANVLMFVESAINGLLYSDYAILLLRVKQQAPLGQPPLMSINMVSAKGFVEGNFKLALAKNTDDETVVEFWLNAVNTHTTYIFSTLLNVEDRFIFAQNPFQWVQSAPAGTSVVAQRNSTVGRAVLDDANNHIANTYLKKTDAAAAYAPKTGTPTHWLINGPTVQDLARIYSASSGFTKILDSKNIFGNGVNKWHCGWFYSYNAYGNTVDGTYLFLKLFVLNEANPAEVKYLITGKYPGPWTMKKI